MCHKTVVPLGVGARVFEPYGRALMLAVGLLLGGAHSTVRAADTALLRLEAKIPLGEVRGRIDHLAFDSSRQYVYVAELGNDSVGVVDTKQGKLVRTLTGLRHPQGIGYVPSSDTVYVANEGDGSVRLFRGADFAPTGTIALLDDADNVRVDDAAHRVFVGYGSGALAVIDSTSQQKISELRLNAHPESFQLEKGGQRIFVNVPDVGEITVAYRDGRQKNESWATAGLRANFPMALDESSGRIFTVFRHPSKVGVIDEKSGRSLATLATCGDSDDLFFDRKRQRLYVICGEGFIDVFIQVQGQLRLQSHIATVAGARTGLFVPDLDRLFLAVRSVGPIAASLWVFGPTLN